MKKLFKKITLFLFLSCFLSNFSLFAQIIFVEDIIDVPDTAIVGKPILLTGTVIPENATFQYITWTIFDAGTTGAAIIANTLYTNAEGIVIINAKITESITGDGFTKNFAIEVFTYVPVEDIIDVPDTAIVGVPLLLTGTVIPENATHQNIIWSVFHAGSTGATITENALHTNSTGVVILTATINETLVGTSFTKIFVIEVKESVGINDLEFVNIKIYPNPTTGQLRITNYELRIERVEIIDVYGRKVGAKFPSNSLEGWQPKADGVVLDISHLQAGIYFVRISSDFGKVVKKVIKQ
jgi:hypothetical protein